MPKYFLLRHLKGLQVVIVARLYGNLFATVILASGSAKWWIGEVSCPKIMSVLTNHPEIGFRRFCGATTCNVTSEFFSLELSTSHRIFSLETFLKRETKTRTRLDRRRGFGSQNAVCPNEPSRNWLPQVQRCYHVGVRRLYG